MENNSKKSLRVEVFRLLRRVKMNNHIKTIAVEKIRT